LGYMKGIQAMHSLYLCYVPFNWWTCDYEMVITSSRLANVTHIFLRSSVLSSWRHHRLKAQYYAMKLYNWQFY